MKLLTLSVLLATGLLATAAPAAAIWDDLRDVPVVGPEVFGRLCTPDDILCDAFNANNPTCDGCIRGSTPVGDSWVCVITPHAAGRITYCSIVAINGTCTIPRAHERVLTVCLP